MLGTLRAEALALIAATPDCTLSTIGPTGVQASVVACVVRDDCVYVLVPSTVDHLFNLEHELEVVLTSTLSRRQRARPRVDLYNLPATGGCGRGTIERRWFACAGAIWGWHHSAGRR